MTPNPIKPAPKFMPFSALNPGEITKAIGRRLTGVLAPKPALIDAPRASFSGFVGFATARETAYLGGFARVLCPSCPKPAPPKTLIFKALGQKRAERAGFP